MQPFNTKIIDRWYKAADPNRNIDAEDLIELIDETNKFTENYKSLKKSNSLEQISEISQEILREIGKHDKEESKALIEFFFHPTNVNNEELNGEACKAFNQMYQVIREVAETSLVFDKIYSKFSSKHPKQLKEKETPFPCYYEKCNQDIENIIQSNLDEKSLKALRLTSTRYKKMDLINNLNKGSGLQELGIFSVEELINYLGDRYCSLIEKLDLSEYIINDKSILFHLTDSDVDNLSKYFPNLTHLSLVNCKISNETAQKLVQLKTLKNLNLSGCKVINDFSFLKSLTLLETLHLKSCISFKSEFLKYFPNSLTHLDISHIDIKKFQASDILPKLEKLDANDCQDLTSITLKNLLCLKTVNASSCSSLENDIDLGNCSFIENLNLSHCRKLSKIPSLKDFKNLKVVSLIGCDGLNNIEALGDLPSLKEVNLAYCSRVINMSVLLTCPSLKKVTITSNQSMSQDLQKKLEKRGVMIIKRRWSSG